MRFILIHQDRYDMKVINDMTELSPNYFGSFNVHVRSTGTLI